MQEYICTCTFLKLARRTRKSTYLGISTPYRWADKITTTGRISKIQLSTFRKWRMLEKCSCRHSAAADPVKMLACMIYKSSVSRTLFAVYASQYSIAIAAEHPQRLPRRAAIRPVYRHPSVPIHPFAFENELQEQQCHRYSRPRALAKLWHARSYHPVQH